MNLLKGLFHIHKWYYLMENTRTFVVFDQTDLVFKIYPKVCERCKAVEWMQQ